MKTKSLIVTVIFLVAGNFSMDLFAQESLKALVQKCENMENVNINVVRKRNTETRKLERQITTVSFGDNQALVNEFIAAFDKEKEKADQEIENRSGGKITNIFYRFGDVSYSFSQGDDGSASITVIEKENED